MSASCKYLHNRKQRGFFNKPFFPFFILSVALTPQALQAATYHIDDDVVGEPAFTFVKPQDTLYDIARRFDTGITALLAANPGVDPWIPKPGTQLNLPTMQVLPPVEHKGIVINLAEMRLYFYPDSSHVMIYPLGIGREGWQTPTGETTIIKKQKNPAWIPPESIRREHPDLPDYFPPGPDNPLGAYAFYLGWHGYRIHGTNKPYGVGSRVSHGCIRLYPEDIEELFPSVAIGTSVTVIDTPYKLGWKNNELWLEVAPTQQQADRLDGDLKLEPIDDPDIYGAIVEAAEGSSNINWQAVRSAMEHPTGMPIVIAGSERP